MFSIRTLTIVFSLTLESTLNTKQEIQIYPEIMTYSYDYKGTIPRYLGKSCIPTWNLKYVFKVMHGERKEGGGGN